MKLARRESLYDNVRKVTVYIKSFGDRKFSPDEEKLILDDFKPVLSYRDIDFTGYYDKIDGEVKKVNPTITYKYDLSVDIPTTYTTGNGIDEHIVTIGLNNISFTTSEVEGSDNFITVRNQAISDFVKADDTLLNVFDTDDITVLSDKIIATKSLVDTEIEEIKINEINSSYGVNSITESQSSNQGGFLVKINVVNRNVEIKEGLECEFSFATSRVLDSELYGQSKDVICEAKVLLFADKIEEAIIDKVKECKLKLTKFEHREEQDLESDEF